MIGLIRTIYRYGFFPMAVVATIAWMLWGDGRAISAPVLLMTAAAVLLPALLLLERLLPYEQDWNRARGDVGTDLFSGVILAGIADPLLKALGPALVIALTAPLGEAYGSAWFPSHWPLPAQLVLVVVLAEFGRYWAHRFSHRFRWLWSLHAMHHSPERLYALNNLRFHPFNHALNYAFGILPLLLLGATVQATVLYAALGQTFTLFQHANLDLRYGWLNYVFSTNEAHRWHHSTHLDEGERNFGSVLLVWDVLFGTHLMPPSGGRPKQLGLSGTPDYPGNGYLRQFTASLGVRCCA
ncbi:MAG: sterol desaturase family protein [Aquisalimonadaceae bacterium]